MERWKQKKERKSVFDAEDRPSKEALQVQSHL